MIKLTKRKGFNFFRSYFDVYNELENDTDKVAFIDALLDRQFLGIKPANLKGMAKFAYISQTNSIDSQVKGYEDKTKTFLDPTQGGSVGVITPPTAQVEEKEKEKVKEDNSIDTRKLKFAHTLKEFVSEYGSEMVRDFYDYWTEPNKTNKKFRQELQKTWSLERRLKTWNSNNFNKNKNGKQINDTNEFKQIAQAIGSDGVRR
jgi:hypothetical protein